MRELPVLQLYSLEEFDRAKTVYVKTAEQCVEEEQKIHEVMNAIEGLKEDKAEYKNDRMVDRIINRLECTKNFLIKASSRFANVEKSMVAKREDLARKRVESQAGLDKHKTERLATIAAAKTKDVTKPEIVPAGMKKVREGNPNFVKGRKNPYVSREELRKRSSKGGKGNAKVSGT